MALTRLRKCECGTEYSVLEHRGKTLCIEADDDRSGCHVCGSEAFEHLVGVGTGIDMGDEAGHGKIYPYFDRGLGRYVKNAKHRKQLCREMNVIPWDGDRDLESMAQRATTAKVERRKRWAATLDRYENAPEFAEYRKLRERGAYDHRLKKRGNDG